MVAEMGLGAGLFRWVKMSIYDELEKLGVWVNRSTGTGIAIEWLRLPEVGA